MSGWLDEPLGPGLVRRWRLDEVFWAGATPYQEVVIARTAHGVTLFCDGERQSAQLSQLLYHEALLVPALLLAQRVRRVLVVGSSEGVVSQLAVAAGAAVVDHVDIDRECVRRCAELLPYGYSVAELAAAEQAAAGRGDGPVRMHYADGWDFVHASVGGYDVVVVDLPDETGDTAAVTPAGAGAPAGEAHGQASGAARDEPAGATVDEAAPARQHDRLYGAEFLRRCRRLLTGGGVLAYQAGCPTLWRNATLARAATRFAEVFGTVAYYGSDEHEWAFLFGRADPVSDPTELMLSRLPGCRYRPVTIDGPALRRGAVPPHAVRVGSRTWTFN
jgi:spermidine synthase